MGVRECGKPYIRIERARQSGRHAKGERKMNTEQDTKRARQIERERRRQGKA